MKNKRILIVEDEVVVAMELQNTLERLGYEVLPTFGRGLPAIEVVKKDNPDVILMDIRIKGDMDGIETASRIQEFSEAPIIFLTAYAEEDKLERAKLILPFGYLLKPIQERDLKVTIEMALYASKINRERLLAQEELKKAHEQLEEKIKERTKELQIEIEERRQTEEYLKIAKKEAEAANQSQTDFLSNISHEIRTPMHQILSFSKFGIDKSDTVKREKLNYYFTKINTIGKNLQLLLNDLLDLSKLKSGKTNYVMEKTDLLSIINPLITEFSLLAQDKGVTLEILPGSQAISTVCDEQKISQVFRNLISNAIKFTPNNKKISVSVNLSQIELINEVTVPAALVKVIDQGVGIPEAELDKVFDKFVQSSKTRNDTSGTGLGLAICKEIVDTHNGLIWAENNNDSIGSTFSILIPESQY